MKNKNEINANIGDNISKYGKLCGAYHCGFLTPQTLSNIFSDISAAGRLSGRTKEKLSLRGLSV
ncbi:MAG: hypothetical protein LBI79_04845 [Nitrososphaerota archaeon]|nr:hypothetical protein [Nitrososphaerota archaeon]